jgi:hypothetical protein
MNKLPRITEIIKIEPFKITCKWTTGEVLVCDFEYFFEEWKNEKNVILLPLTDYQNFKNVSISETNTLHWLNLQIPIKNFNGNIEKFPLDLCPDVLYQKSKPIKYYKLIPLIEIEQEEIEMI